MANGQATDSGKVGGRVGTDHQVASLARLEAGMRRRRVVRAN